MNQLSFSDIEYSNRRRKTKRPIVVIAKLGKDENVSTEVLCKIGKALECGLDDIIEIIPDEEEGNNSER